MEKEFGLKVVDAFDLDAEVRSLLRPHEMAEDKHGRQHRLPRYFYEVPSHEAAKDIRLTSQFGLNEFLLVDLKEAQRLRNYPRYVPCAVRLLAFYLQRLRDEAHRFAIGTHRQKRAKSLTASSLDDVPGIGPSRKRALLMHFGTARAVKGAALEDLERAPGISKTIARIVYDHFHPAG